MISFHKDHLGESSDSGEGERDQHGVYFGGRVELTGLVETGWAWNMQIEEESRTTLNFLTKHLFS